MVGEDLDHYVEANLAGFIRPADTLGGVQVFAAMRSGTDLPAALVTEGR